MTDLRYIFSQRDDLPDALFSMQGNSINTESSPYLFSNASQGAVLGFSTENLDLGYTSPSLVILSTTKTAELFAWLKTYAAETYPLSQFGRVVSADDFKAVESPKNTSNIYWKRPDRWSSIVIGEILAQSDSDPIVSILPLSRANATFSFAVAKSAVAHRNDSVTDECIRRLKILSSDKRFLDRSLSLIDINPVWRNLGYLWDNSQGLEQLLSLITAPSNELFESPHVTARNTAFTELLSDSVEHRVLAFRNFLGANNINEKSYKDDSSKAFDIALAAFLVGRGTSHVFLLKESARLFPAVYVWFGLFAGLAGPIYWDIAWARAAKGIEKTLNSNFSWTESLPCDISWPEYLWIASIDNEKLIADIPKQLPKVLTIEVFPGATCQLRMKSANPIQQNLDVPIEKPFEESVFPQAELVYDFIREFIKVSDKHKLGIDVSTIGTDNANISKPTTPAKRNKRNR